MLVIFASVSSSSVASTTITSGLWLGGYALSGDAWTTIGKIFIVAIAVWAISKIVKS